MLLKVKACLSLGRAFVARRVGRGEEGKEGVQLVPVPEPYLEPPALTGGPYSGPKPEGFLDPARSLPILLGGFRAFRADTLRSLELADVSSQGYCFQVDMAWRVVRAGLHVVEVPITFVERERGESKMSAAIVREALWRVTAWGARYRASQLIAAARRVASTRSDAA